jgi:hypothetical protein
VKRAFLHIAFWFCYFIQFDILQFLWSKANLPQLSETELIMVTLAASAAYMIPQLLFSYYVSYYGITPIVKHKRNMFYNTFEILAVLFICIVIDRLIANYIVLPYVYDGAIKPLPIFEPRYFFIGLLYIGFASGSMLSVKAGSRPVSSKRTREEPDKRKTGS